MAMIAPSSDRGTFVTTLGQDTVAIESFTRTPSIVDGEIIVRMPGTVLLHYTTRVGPNGELEHSVVDIAPLGTNAVFARQVTLNVVHDTLSIDVDSSGHHSRGRVSISGPACPQLMTGFGASYGLYDSPTFFESCGAIASASAGDTVRFAAIDIASGRLVKRWFVKLSSNVLDADYFGIGRTRFALGQNGEIISGNATETTEQTQIRRIDFMDLHAIADRFAAEDHAGKGLGAASPDVIARGTVGGKQVVVTYGSPRRRGRSILGTVVPFAEVWRTGANEATLLFLDRNYDIGGAAVPAGTYSVWTVPSRDGKVDLIINSQHGQWGTDYDKSRDLFHIPMQVSSISPPREDFTIAIGNDGGSSSLDMSWDTFRWSVPISPAK